MTNTNKKTFELFRDKELVFTGTEIECMRYIHKKHSFSFRWAFLFEGYSMEEKAK